MTSCSQKIIPIAGTYPTTPIIINSENSFDKSWDKLIDIFAQKGLSIKVIDRTSGLIVSSKAALSATMENKNGLPVNPEAFIVVPSIMRNGRKEPITGTNAGPYAVEKKIKANDVFGEWNVRIKPNGTGSTINVNINNISYDTYVGSALVSANLNSYKSTGVFEMILSNAIK
jgi:hypothetical protein